LVRADVLRAIPETEVADLGDDQELGLRERLEFAVQSIAIDSFGKL
jgi:hypothetical protein